MIFTAVLIRMADIIDTLVSICSRANVTFGISLHEVCVRTGVRYVITKVSCVHRFLDCEQSLIFLCKFSARKT